MIRFNCFLFYSFLFLFFPFFSNASNIDSLKNELNISDGKRKVEILMKLCVKLRFINADSALKYGNIGIAAAEKENDKSSKAYLLNNMGSVFLDKSDFKMALQYYFDAQKIMESISNADGVSMTNRNIGIVYEQQGMYDQAMSSYEAALNVATENKDTNNIAMSMNSIGSLYYAQKNNDKALEFFKKSLQLMEKLNSKKGIADALNNVAVVYEDMGDYSNALYFHQRSLFLARQQKDSKGIATSLHNIGLIYKDKKRYDLALTYVDSSIVLSKQIRAFDILVELYQTVSEIYKSQNNFEKSLEAFQLSVIAKDSLFNQERSKQIVEMSTKYETEKKEKQNQILKQTVQIQELASTRQRIILYSVSLLSVLMITLAFFIYRGYRQKHIANEQLAQKNLVIQEKSIIVEEQNKDIKDSIRYAKRIQEAILSPQERFAKLFPDSFILFKPKDIVSGDFYWFDQFGDKALFAAADCTGHGVPGAFMSILGFNLLNQAVNEYALNIPNVILNSVNRGLTKALHQKADGSIVQDGMDIALCSIDLKKNILEYAGAYNPAWVIRDKKLIEFTGDKFPIGEFLGGEEKKFTNHEMPLQSGDCVYVFSDGFADQFGGPKGKKFRYKQMLELLIAWNDKPMQEQGRLLDIANDEWRRGIEQVDDILIIGVKI